MKILVAIKTCHRLDYYVDDNTQDYLIQKGLRCLDQQARVNSQRETWLTALPEGVDYKFFYGTRLRDITSKPNQCRPSVQPALREPLSDEVFLPCGDNYTFNSHKVKEICRWALANGYTGMWLVDDDTFIFPERLFKIEPQDFDNYLGGSNGSFAPGSCIFLSSVAMQAIVEARITSTCDDLWIGQVMADNGYVRGLIRVQHGFGNKYQVGFDEALHSNAVSLHSMTPDVMRRLWTYRTTLLSELAKGMVGQVSKTTPSLLPSQGSEDVKSSSFVISQPQLETPSPNLDSSLSTTSVPEITPSSNDSVSSETGSPQINETSGTSSIVISET